MKLAILGLLVWAVWAPSPWLFKAWRCAVCGGPVINIWRLSVSICRTDGKNYLVKGGW